MGVTACGKSTIAALLAEHLGATLIEADELHSEANIEKMRRGEALSDDDRWPWLNRVANTMQACNTGVVVSCSALRRAYRDKLLNNTGAPIGFVHLNASHAVIASRMSNRENHFMPVGLLDSQLALLEPLEYDENGVVIDIDQTIADVVSEAIEFVTKQHR